MDNTAEISRNKKQIEELEKLLENSKSKIIGIEHMMAELDVHITQLPDEFQNKKGQFENKLKQLTAHTEVLFKEKSSQARIKLKNIEKDISKNNAILAEIEQDKKKKLSLLKVKREQLKSKIKLENDKVSDLKHKISTLSKVNFEVNDAADLCLSFADKDLIATPNKVKISEFEAFIEALEGEQEFEKLKAALSHVHYVMTKLDSNF